MAQQRQQVIIQTPPGPSAFAITGLVFAILGWFTCGLLCIPGAFFCLLALFGRGSKAVPIAGLIIGFPGTIFFGFVGLSMILGFLGIGAAATTTTAGVAAGGFADNSTAMADFQGSGETGAAQPKSGPQESVIDKLLKERTEAFESELANWQEESLKIQDSIDELEGQLRATREATPKKPVFESRVWRAQGGFEATGSLLMTDNVTFKIKKSDGSTSPDIPKQKVAAADQAYLEVAFRKLTKYSQDQASYDETIKQLQVEIDEQKQLASNLENSKPVAPKRDEIMEEIKLQNEDSIEQQSNASPQSDQQKKTSDDGGTKQNKLGQFNATNWAKVKTGMTLQEVIAILGPFDSELSRVSIEGIPETVVYAWKSDQFLSVANGNATFQGGKLTVKAQFGL